MSRINVFVTLCLFVSLFADVGVRAGADNSVYEKKIIPKLNRSSQFFNANHEDEIIAKISNVEANRISLTNDRIVSVVSADMSSYKIENNKKTGDIYLLPNLSTERPQNIFITSEAGKTYKLILAPGVMISQQIIITNTNLKVADNLDLKDRYYSFVVEKIKELAMKPLVSTNLVASKSTDKVKINFYEKYSFGDLVFLKGRIRNLSGRRLVLDKDLVPFEHRRAVWFDVDKLGMGQPRMVIVVVSKGGDYGLK